MQTLIENLPTPLKQSWDIGFSRGRLCPSFVASVGAQFAVPFGAQVGSHFCDFVGSRFPSWTVEFGENHSR